MSDYNRAIRQMARVRIGADTMPTTGTAMDVARARLLGIAALNTFLGVQNHKRYLFWGVKKDGSYFSYASDVLRDMQDAMGFAGYDDNYAPATNSKYGDLSNLAYAAYWDSNNPKGTALDEYLGELTVSATAEPSKPVATVPVKKSSGMGWLLGLLGVGGLGFMLTRKKGG